jgi:hypothetical protein
MNADDSTSVGRYGGSEASVLVAGGALDAGVLPVAGDFERGVPVVGGDLATRRHTLFVASCC